MRITNKVLTKNFLSNLRVNLEEMQKYQDQLSSGHEVRKPSDDPFRVARTMELKASIAANERYHTNIQEGVDWLNSLDEALEQIGEAFQTIREKIIQGSNGAYTKDERLALAKQIRQLKEHIMDIGNTAYDGRYLFGGDKTTNPPFKMDNGKVIYQGSKNGLFKEMANGVIIDISVKGSDFANDPNNAIEDGLFATLSNIIDKLENDQNPSDLLGKVDEHFNNLLRLRAEVGAKQKRLEDMLSKNETETFNMTELLSKTYDVDVAKKVMEYKVMESVYTASLQTGAKILQPSLLDFLR